MAKTSDNDFSDEDLMTFADGQCGTELKNRIESAMQYDQSLAKRVEMFQSTTSMLKAAFPPVAKKPVDVALAAMISGSGQAAAEKPANTSNVVQFPKIKKPQPFIWQQAIAASVLLATGVAGGYLLGSPNFVSTTGVASLNVSPEVAQVLTSIPSGAAGKTTAGELTVIASFKDSQGRFCREFESGGASVAKTVTIACKREANWQVVLQAALPAPSDAFLPAGGSQALEAFLQAAGMDEPLSQDEEKALLRLK